MTELYLKPCPNCGGEAAFKEPTPQERMTGLPHPLRIACLHCKVTTCEIMSDATGARMRLAEDWNTGAIIPKAA